MRPRVPDARHHDSESCEEPGAGRISALPLPDTIGETRRVPRTAGLLTTRWSPTV